MVTQYVIYHKDTQVEGYFTEAQMRQEHLSPSHFANVLHYAKTGFEGVRADVDRHDNVLYGIDLASNAARFMETAKYLRLVQPENYGALRQQFLLQHPDLAAELNHRHNSLEAPLADAKFLELTAEQFIAAVKQTIITNYQRGSLDSLHSEPHFCYIRPLGYRGDLRHGGQIVDRLGVFSLTHEPVFEISVRAAKPYIKGRPKLVVSSTGIVGDHLNIKLGANYVPYGQGKDDALYNGFSEVLFTTARSDQAFVTFAARTQGPLVNEGGGENFFGYTQDGRLVTPPVSSGRILPGTKRALAIEIARNLGIIVEEREIPLAEVSSLKGVVLTGTWAGLEPVELIYDPVTGEATLYDPAKIEVLELLKREYHAVLKGGTLSAQANAAVRSRVRVPILTLDRAVTS